MESQTETMLLSSDPLLTRYFYSSINSLTDRKNDYVNWGANPSGNLKPGYQNTVIKELPFVGRTIYRDNYQGNQGGKDDDMARLISNSRYGMFR